jgi:membrane fusion protein (multidrug efflux system)
MTFLVSQDGVVFQKDLGPDAESIARAITAFDPDETSTCPCRAPCSAFVPPTRTGRGRCAFRATLAGMHRSAPLALATCLALACSGGEPGPREAGEAPPPSVTVARVLPTLLPDERERVGQVKAIDDVEVRARIEGFLEQRLFEEGSDVAKGDLLFVIERAPYEARVAEAEADLARARASLTETQLDLERTKELRKKNVSTQAQLDTAVARQAGAGAEVLAAEAALTQARLNLDYTEIHAPVAGRVGRAFYSPGNLVGPDSGPLLTLASLDPIYVYWQVPENAILDYRRRNVARAKQGEAPLRVTAQLRFGDGSFYEHPGVWDFLDNRVDPTTGTQTARAEFPNPEGLLLAGQYVAVIVQIGEPHHSLIVPQAAVQEDQAGRFVLVVDDEDKVELRRVVMGMRLGIFWEVRSGLTEGERVIYQGIQKVQPGTRVAAVEHTPEPPVGGAPGARATGQPGADSLGTASEPPPES